MTSNSKKVLLVATVVKKHINAFHIPLLKMLKEMGYTTYVAAKNDFNDDEVCEISYCDYYFNLPFERNPLKFRNIFAYKELKKLIKKENFDVVHCHTPVGGMIARLACRKARKQGTRVFYTAHGFHFYKGAPLKNWLLYYPAEKFCAHFTDVLITINQEDYALAQKKMKAKKVVYVPGVGIDLQKFGNVTVDKAAKRKELGIPEEATWILNVGELIPRKNQETLIRAVAEIENIYLTIAGQGELTQHLIKVINELKVVDRVKLLGYRTDISELCKACDMFAFPSFHEGLPVAVMEAMASGLPVVCSNIRGNTDLIDEEGGILFDPYSVAECKDAIEMMQKKMVEFGNYNEKKIKKYSCETVNKQMMHIFS